MLLLPEELKAAYHGLPTAVLGASGFIGRWVGRALSQADAELHLLVRDPGPAADIFERYGVRGQVHPIDLRDFSALQELICEIRPAITFNMAGYGVDRSERDETTANLLNAELPGVICKILAEVREIRWKGQDLVHVGSALEYGEICGDLREDSPPKPTTLYGKSKLAGTLNLSRASRNLGVKGMTARLFTVYGPGEHPGRLLPSLLETARTGDPLPLTAGRQRRDFTFVADVAEGLLRLGQAAAEPGEVVNLASGRLQTVRSFVETAASVLGIQPDQLRFGALPTRAEEMEHEPVVISRLSSLISWTPPSVIEEGIRQTMRFENLE